MQADTQRNLIQPEDLIQTETVVRKRKEKRNTYVKAWRQGKKFEKRQSLFVQEYVEEKYQSIYAEAVNFYNMINGLYPKKNDLRKTKEFRQWKKLKPANPESSSTTTTTATTSQAAQDPAVEQNNNSTIPQAETAQQEVEIGAQFTVEVAPLQITPQAITDQRIDEIIQDLRSDPDLNAIINNIEIPADEDDIFW